MSSSRARHSATRPSAPWTRSRPAASCRNPSRPRSCSSPKFPSPRPRDELAASTWCVLRQAQDEEYRAWHLSGATKNGPHPELVEGRTAILQRHRACSQPLPRLNPRPEVELVGPGAALLAMELPVIFGDGIRSENAVALLEGVALRKIVADEGGVDGAVDHDMRDMDALGAELAGHA